MRKNPLSLTFVLAGLALGLASGCHEEAPQPAPVPAPPWVTPPQVTPPQVTPPPEAPAATGLAYTDPTGTAGWRLLKDASSTPTRLVLNLVGPSGLKTRGVGFNLQAPPRVKFGAFDNGLPIRDLGVYKLRKNDDDLNEPVALVGGVKPGNVLSVGIFQKDRARGAKDSGVALCQVAIEFDPGAQLKAGDSLELSLVKSGAIPEDIGGATDDLWTLSQKLRLEPVSIQVGALTAS